MEKAEESSIPAEMKELVVASKKKLVNGHLWYLSERLVPLSLFSHRVTEVEKSEMVLKLQVYEGKEKPGQQEQPAARKWGDKKLKDFIGPDSYTFLYLFGVEPSFLNKPVSEWSSDLSYSLLKGLVCSTKVVNDSAERALGLITEFNSGQVTHDEDQKQWLYQVVQEMRRQQKEAATSTERCTKTILKTVHYDVV